MESACWRAVVNGRKGLAAGKTWQEEGARRARTGTGLWHKKYVVFRRMRYDWPFQIASRDDAIGSLIA